MSGLPDKQQRILDFIRVQHAETGVFPSVREIAAHMDFKSTNTVDYHLRRMEASGVLERGSRRARSFSGFATAGTNRRVGDAAPRATRRGSARPGYGHDSHASIPLIGRVAAGEPILAEQHVEDVIDFGSLFRPDETTFALRVSGDSMIDAGIMDGDVVIVRQQDRVANGEIGVAVVDNEATVKRIYDEGKRWRLQPENSALEPIMVVKGESEFSVAGKVIGVVRQV